MEYLLSFTIKVKPKCRSSKGCWMDHFRGAGQTQSLKVQPAPELEDPGIYIPYMEHGRVLLNFPEKKIDHFRKNDSGKRSLGVWDLEVSHLDPLRHPGGWGGGTWRFTISRDPWNLNAFRFGGDGNHPLLIIWRSVSFPEQNFNSNFSTDVEKMWIDVECVLCLLEFCLVNPLKNRL